MELLVLLVARLLIELILHLVFLQIYLLPLYKLLMESVVDQEMLLLLVHFIGMLQVEVLLLII